METMLLLFVFYYQCCHGQTPGLFFLLSVISFLVSLLYSVWIPSSIIFSQSHSKLSLTFFLFFLPFFFCFLGSYPQHVEVAKLGFALELQLLAYTTATATQDPSDICDLYHSSQQHLILDPLRKARIKLASSWIQVRFVSTVPQWELLCLTLLLLISVPFLFYPSGLLNTAGEHQLVLQIKHTILGIHPHLGPQVVLEYLTCSSLYPSYFP